MTPNNQEILLLRRKLDEHDNRLIVHRRRTEDVWDRLQNDIEELSNTYQLLQWWRELRKLFEPHMEQIALHREDVRRAGSRGKSELPMDIRTLYMALGEYQDLVGDLAAYLKVKTEKSGLGELIQWVEEVEKDWNDRCQEIKAKLDKNDVGTVVEEFSNFWTQVKVSFYTIDKHIGENARKIGDTASSLQQEARKVAAEVNTESEGKQE